MLVRAPRAARRSPLTAHARRTPRAARRALRTRAKGFASGIGREMADRSHTERTHASGMRPQMAKNAGSIRKALDLHADTVKVERGGRVLIKYVPVSEHSPGTSLCRTSVPVPCSTHSRSSAAADIGLTLCCSWHCFYTQSSRRGWPTP